MADRHAGPRLIERKAIGSERHDKLPPGEFFAVFVSSDFTTQAKSSPMTRLVINVLTEIDARLRVMRIHVAATENR